MAGDGNKVGELRVDIVADTTKFDAAVAKVKGTTASGAAGAAVGAASPASSAAPAATAAAVVQAEKKVEEAVTAVKAAEVAVGEAAVVAGIQQEAAAVKATTANVGLLKGLARIKTAFAQIAIPVAVGLGIVKLIDYLGQLSEAAKRVGDSYAKISNDEGKSVAKRIRDIKGESDAVKDLLEQTNAYIDKLKEKRDADIEEWSGVSGALKAAAINRRQEDIIANIGDAYEVAADKARGFFTAVQNAQIDKAADDAEKAAKKARDTARLASMTGEDAIMEKSYQDVEALEEKKAKAKSDRERDAYDEQIALVLEVAEYAAEKERKSHEQKLDDIAREHAEERSSIERIAQARSQALVDFNNQARTSLNDLLSTAGIQTGMDKIANILLAIKSSQGAV